jgi:hypothetical protein
MVWLAVEALRYGVTLLEFAYFHHLTAVDTQHGGGL